MNVFRIDCKGLACPQPVIQTKEALEQGASNLEIVVDNEASKENVARFARSQNCDVSIDSLDDGGFRLTLTRGSSTGTNEFNPSDYACPVPTGGGLVYVISADSMGRGNEELGWGLLQTYIQTIEKVSPLPQKILMYNAGVKLVAQGSGALEALRRLQERGVEILVCGTCLDFFQLKSVIQVGQISNMYDIMTSMIEAGKVVSPM